MENPYLLDDYGSEYQKYATVELLIKDFIENTIRKIITCKRNTKTTIRYIRSK